jgi:ubiquinone biosynthesis protein UbiJ
VTSDGQATQTSEGGVPFALPLSLLAALEGVLNRYIALDPEGARGFEPIYGRIICVEIEGLGARLTLIPGPDRVQVFGAYDATPDCLIRGTPLALARLGMAERKDQALSTGAVRIEGDTAIAQALSDAMAGLAVDWEEQLSRVLGDPIANQIGRGLRAAGEWGERTSQTLKANLKEYLEEEGRLLPSRAELDDFLQAVDHLRDDVERLAARVAQLARAAETGTGHGDAP